MATSGDKEFVEVVLACSFCKEPFSDPRVVTTCGHNLCVRCLQAIASQHPRGHVTCPSCHSVTVIADAADIAKLPKPPLGNEREEKPISKEVDLWAFIEQTEFILLFYYNSTLFILNVSIIILIFLPILLQSGLTRMKSVWKHQLLWSHSHVRIVVIYSSIIMNITSMHCYRVNDDIIIRMEKL